jgi:hypothetical protein
MRTGLLAAMLLAGCSPSKPVVEGQPPITADGVAANLIGKGPNEGLEGWRFDAGEPREVQLVSTEYAPDAAVATVYVKTEEASRPTMSGPPQRMAGKVRVHYSWTEQNWHLVRLENVSFKKQ